MKTNLELDRALALAIGYLPEHVRIEDDYVVVFRPTNEHMQKNCIKHDWMWVVFDHTSWKTIAPIAEKYNCFPSHCNPHGWFSSVRGQGGSNWAPTPEAAIAMAVIASKQG